MMALFINFSQQLFLKTFFFYGFVKRGTARYKKSTLISEAWLLAAVNMLVITIFHLALVFPLACSVLID